MELMFVGEVSLEIVMGQKCLQAKRAVVPSREPTEELMEVEVTNWQSLQRRRGKSLWCIQMLWSVWEKSWPNAGDDGVYSIRRPVVGSAVCLLMRCISRWSLLLNDLRQRKQ
jgi:hypothetical protein